MTSMIYNLIIYTSLLIVLLDNNAGEGKLYFVSPNGSDKAAGTEMKPFKSIQTAVNNAAGGDTIYLREGVYREAITIPVNKKNLVLLAYPSEKPILKGSDLKGNWATHGKYWKKYIKVQPQQVMVNGNNPLQQIGYPNKDFKLNQSYPRYKYPEGTGLSDLKSGSFFWQNDTLYLRLKDDSDPNKQTIEVSQREQILNILADSVIVRGLQFRHSNINTFQEQGAAVSLGNYSVLEDCDVQWCDFGGVSMGSWSKAINVNASNNGATGFSASNCYDFLISHCTANANNYRNFYAQWHAGGFKGASSAWGTIENSEFSDNIGAGIWFDYCFQREKYRKDGPKPIYVRNNLVRNNSKTTNKNSALMIEVSEEANVENNLVINNDYRGIYISGSWNCNILNNIVAFNRGHYGIDLAGMPRNEAKLSNNRVQNNIIYNNETKYDINILKDNGRDIKNNICDYNLIYRDEGSVSLKYDSVYHNIEDWKKNTPYGRHSISKSLWP